MPVPSSPEFHQASDFVPLILLAYFFNGVYLQLAVGLLIEKKTRTIAGYSLLTAMANLALNFLLIPEFGAWGAALTTLLSFMVLSMLVFIGSQKVFPIKYEWERVIILLLVAAAIFYGASSLSFASLGLSITIKFLLAASFPFVLWLLPFYRTEERELVRAAVSSSLKWVKGS